MHMTLMMDAIPTQANEFYSHLMTSLQLDTQRIQEHQLEFPHQVLQHHPLHEEPCELRATIACAFDQLRLGHCTSGGSLLDLVINRLR